MSKWTDRLTVDDVPEQYQQMAQAIGVANLLKLADVYGGDRPYIPKRDALLRISRNRLIRKQFNGYNAKELARYYGLTNNRVLQICKMEGGGDSPEEEPATPDDGKEELFNGQLAMWECL